MVSEEGGSIVPGQIHPWLRHVRAAFVPHDRDLLLDQVSAGIRQALSQLGHDVVDTPDQQTDLLVTTYRYGEPLSWRHAQSFVARRRYRLSHSPTVFTLVHMTTAEFDALMARLEAALAQDPVRPADLAFPGLAPEAWEVLADQGKRGGAILSLLRVLQAQSKCIRLLLALGDECPEKLYHFDLVGAHPSSDPAQGDAFYTDIALRMVTSVSTNEVTDHQVVGETISAAQWQQATVPAAMRRAGAELGSRGFFTNMIRIADLVHVPAVSDAISSQYSEGCFSSWEPRLPGLVATVTGSARPVDKGRLTDDDLAVLVGITPGGGGAQVRHVAGLANTAPSTEAVEMLLMDVPLPQVTLDAAQWGGDWRVPVIRSRLHGHRGVSAYDPRFVAFAPLDEPYYRYLVSCGTDAQAEGIRAAFARTPALLNPDDPRKVVFTVLPGHGAMIVEKWIPGSEPFQTIWEYMDAGYILIDRLVPQGQVSYLPGAGGLMRLVTLEG